MEFSLTKIVVDERGETHFEVMPAIELQSFWPGVEFSDSLPASGYMLERFAGEFQLDWHTPPDDQRYFEFFIQGKMGLEVSDGEKRIFAPGDGLFFDDMTGKGHRAFGVEPGLSVVLKVP